MADIINGCFELLAGLFCTINCFRLYKDKKVRGISILSTVFFTSWGFWNLYYYPSLGQTMSFIGGIFIVTTNVVWVSQMIYYTRKEKKALKEEIESRMDNS